jgi:hypothetical protein
MAIAFAPHRAGETYQKNSDVSTLPLPPPILWEKNIDSKGFRGDMRLQSPLLIELGRRVFSTKDLRASVVGSQFRSSQIGC